MSTRSHRGLRTRAAVVAASCVAIAGLGVGIGTASASASSVHRGVSGCFAWSYGKGVTITSRTVYWHNRCSTTHRLKISYVHRGSIAEHTTNVKGHAKGHKKLDTKTIRYIKDEGRTG
ncbi:hypothetical protein OG417_00885 [Actinoallomurus sp. NBC_01490]|uniref:hypothetical protein n=1 Tax=Actinoallomurus sp. NBC_01490 TaxID=2903557 RepID=UPI002E36060B|nr:hypothetical protein [Actinoallomurus sp. NBC_01490]